MKLHDRIKYFFKKFNFLRSYNSPFIKPSIKIYIGKIRFGTPYFFPRRWVKSKTNPGYLTAIPKKIGFDFVALGWKTKYDDYRFEWSPIWSFVFFRYQIAIIFTTPHPDQYWESWLYYINDTDKSSTIQQRLSQCRKHAPCTWTTYKDGVKITTDYYQLILKDKYLTI